MKLKSGINIEVIEFEDNENTRKGLYETLALCYPPSVVGHGGWAYEEVNRIFQNRKSGSCLIAVTDAKNIRETGIQMLYRDEWKARIKSGMNLDDYSIKETPIAAKEIFKTTPHKFLEAVSKKRFNLTEGKIIVGMVLGYIASKKSCQVALWDGNCSKKHKGCTEAHQFGYIYHIWSTLRGVGSILGFEATKNLIENGAEVVSEHSRAEGFSEKLFNKLGYVKESMLKGFLPEGGDAYPMCITRKRFEEMKPKYKDMGLI